MKAKYFLSDGKYNASPHTNILMLMAIMLNYLNQTVLDTFSKKYGSKV